MNIDELLEQIFDYGYATKEIKIGSKITVKIKSLAAKDYLDLDPVLATTKGTKLFVLQKYGVEKLSRAILNYNNMKFETPEKTKEFLENLPAAVLDKLIKEQTLFEKDITKALSPENVEQNFFEEPGSVEKLEQQPKE